MLRKLLNRLRRPQIIVVNTFSITSDPTAWSKVVRFEKPSI